MGYQMGGAMRNAIFSSNTSFTSHLVLLMVVVCFMHMIFGVFGRLMGAQMLFISLGGYKAYIITFYHYFNS